MIVFCAVILNVARISDQNSVIRTEILPFEYVVEFRIVVVTLKKFCKVLANG